MKIQNLKTIFLKAVSLIFLVLPHYAGAQNQAKIDSLNNELNQTNSDSLKIEIYDRLFSSYYQNDPHKSKWFFEEIFTLSHNTNSKRGFFKGYFAKASYFAMLAKFDSSLFYFNKAYDIVKELKDEKETVKALLAISHIHLWKNEVENAKETAKQALAVAEKIAERTSLALTFKIFGEIYSMQSKLDSAVLFYLNAIKILEENGKEKSKLGDLYVGIGEVYLDLGNTAKAEEFLAKSIELLTQIKDEDGLMFATSLMGGVYFQRNEFEEAIETLTPVLEYYKSVGDPYRISENNRYLGLSHLNLGNYAKAKKFLIEAVATGREAAEPINLAEALMAQGDLYLKNEEYVESLKNYLEAEGLFLEVQFAKGALKSAELLSRLYNEYGDYKNAFVHLSKYINLKDSIDKVANATLVQQLEAQYQNDKKQHQIELLEAQRLFIEQEKAIQKNLFIAGTAGLIILILVFYILFKTNQKAHKKLKQLDSLKSRFFANISHEFRTPLTLISGPIEHKLHHDELEAHEKADFEMISRNSRRLLNLVDQLLDLSKIESGSYNLKVGKGDLSKLLQSLASSFEYAAKLKDISFTVSIASSPMETWHDKDAIQKVVVNLLSNAFKYSPEKGRVKFIAEIEGGKLELTCQNSGPGISMEDQQKIFGRFYQVNGEAGGAGIGLALVKELTDLHNGKISISSVPEQLTTFKIELPVNKKSFPKGTIFKDYNPELKNVDIDYLIKDIDEPGFEYIDNNERPVLLIVDDNNDIIHFIKNVLSSDYKILESRDGKKGIELALKQIPDIIISDIMMPGTDGIELCRTLKSDERTSHIPIILLTAKAGDEDRLMGFETGADDYITKPFNSEVLKVRLEKLIEIRRKLQERFSQEVVLKPKDIAITSADQIFMEKVQQLIDTKLMDSSFNAETFSKELGMSRMQLHRKLTGLTGLSANHFIRMYRIKLATTLLASPGINISEVGYMVGFNNPSYFAKCFKEFHNCTPSEYAQRLALNNLETEFPMVDAPSA